MSLLRREITKTIFFKTEEKMESTPKELFELSEKIEHIRVKYPVRGIYDMNLVGGGCMIRVIVDPENVPVEFVADWLGSHGLPVREVTLREVTL